jgi:hypothetical protein
MTTCLTVVTHWAGKWLAKILPNKEINLYFFKFNLVSYTTSFVFRRPVILRNVSLLKNPGPFSVKEHVLVTLSASAGATSNLGEIIVSVKELFYDEYMHPVAAIGMSVETVESYLTCI